MEKKQIRVSSIIILRWLATNEVELKHNLSEVKKKYTKDQLGIGHAAIDRRDLSTELLTEFLGIRKSFANEWFK